MKQQDNKHDQEQPAATGARRRQRRGWLTQAAFAAPLFFGGCSGGCDGPQGAAVDPSERLRAGALVADTAVPLPLASTLSNADAAEKALDVALPLRVEDDIFPGLGTLPRRRLGSFDPGRNFIAKIHRDGVIIFDTAVSSADLDDDERLEATLRRSAEDYATRAGIAANRVVLVVDRNADRSLATRLRSAAHRARSWRVVALAREEGTLVEVMLDPPPASRP